MSEYQYYEWQTVDRILANGQMIASVYDQATALLEKLQQLAEFQDTRDHFQQGIQLLVAKYGSRPGLIKRWKPRGWV